MKSNALVYLAGSLLATNFAVAHENSQVGLDILASAGYSHFNGLKESISKKDLNYNGYNLNVSALYSIMKMDFGAPVIGLGVNYYEMYSNKIKENNVSINNNTAKIDYEYKDNMKSLAIMGNVGYKFTPTTKFAVYSLLNFGYEVYNTVNSSSSRVNKNPVGNTNSIYVNPEIKYKDHYIYGASLVGTYEIVANLSLGLGATYNRHQVKREAAATGSSNFSFNEFSTNLIATYSF